MFRMVNAVKLVRGQRAPNRQWLFKCALWVMTFIYWVWKPKQVS